MTADEEKRLATLLDIWKQSIDVQKHFNEMSLQVRNYLITILSAIVGGAAFLYNEGYNLIAGIVLILAGVVISFSIYLMDALWYHRLLKGSVDHGKEVEDAIKGLSVPQINLGEKISQSSKVKIFGLGKELNTVRRLNIFYALLASMILAVGLALIFIPPKKEDEAHEEVCSTIIFNNNQVQSADKQLERCKCANSKK